MFHANLLGDVSHACSLFVLELLRRLLPVVRDCEDGRAASYDPAEGLLVIDVALDDFNALLCQCLGSRLGGVASDAADLVLGGELWVVENGVDDAAALVASGAEDRDELGHVGLGVVWCEISGWAEDGNRRDVSA